MRTAPFNADFWDVPFRTKEVEALAYQHFKLPAFFTLQDIKDAYRSRSKELHPDRGGDAVEFREMKAAYDKLIKYAVPNFISAERLPRTRDGSYLHELGLGLGPRVNGKPCPSCDRRGYHRIEEAQYVKAGECRKCRGLGTRGWRICTDCGGRGHYLRRVEPKIVFERCYKCTGTGELEVFNCVIPKGAILHT